MKYDLFISHAKEDRDSFVLPLVVRLEEVGYRVWFDEFEITVGDNIFDKIHYGLSNSQYGIVVLSPFFLGKTWTNYELHGLLIRHITQKTILPIWLNITLDEIKNKYPPLASVAAIVATTDLSLIVTQLSKVVQPLFDYDDKVIATAKKLMAEGNYDCAVIKAAIALEKFLRQHAIQKLGADFFKPPNNKIENYSIYHLIKLLHDKHVIKTKNTSYSFNWDDFSRLRNIAVHGSSDRIITQALAKQYLDHVREFIIVNSTR